MRLTLSLFLALSAGCDDWTSGAGNFLGTYDATWRSEAVLSLPEDLPPQLYTASGELTTEDNSCYSFTLTDAGNGCALTFQRTGDCATSVPADQVCRQTLTNGSVQTSLMNCKASIAARSMAVYCHGDLNGIAANGGLYIGHYSGGWTATKR